MTVSVEKMVREFEVPRVIDYMSLDIEGSEEWAFETFSWHIYTFLVITVERPKSGLKDMLATHGYEYICDHGTFGDEMWMHTSFHNIDAARKSLNPGSTKGHESRTACRSVEIGEMLPAI